MSIDLIGTHDDDDDDDDDALFSVLEESTNRIELFGDSGSTTTTTRLAHCLKAPATRLNTIHTTKCSTAGDGSSVRPWTVPSMDVDELAKSP